MKIYCLLFLVFVLDSKYVHAQEEETDIPPAQEEQTDAPTEAQEEETSTKAEEETSASTKAEEEVTDPPTKGQEEVTETTKAQEDNTEAPTEGDTETTLTDGITETDVSVTTIKSVTLTTKSSVKQKSGSCAAAMFQPQQCSRIRASSGKCRTDFNCPGTMKCCDNGCGLVCRPASAVKPGTCPRFSIPSCRVKQCSADSDCYNRLKCCADGCRCTSPVNESRRQG